MIKGMALLMLYWMPMWAQTKSGDYKVDVRVVASRIASASTVFRGDSIAKSTQNLTVLIDGTRYELESEMFLAKGIVALGNYKARLVEDQQRPTHEYTKTYEVQFADRSTRKYRVIGQLE